MTNEQNSTPRDLGEFEHSHFAMLSTYVSILCCVLALYAMCKASPPKINVFVNSYSMYCVTPENCIFKEFNEPKMSRTEIVASNGTANYYVSSTREITAELRSWAQERNIKLNVLDKYKMHGIHLHTSFEYIFQHSEVDDKAEAEKKKAAAS